MATDVLNHPLFLWGLLGVEVLILLVGLILKNRIRFRVTLLTISLIANAVFAGQAIGSIYASGVSKLLLGVAWPLLNLAWLVWILRTRTHRGMAESPKRVIPEAAQKRGRGRKASEAPPESQRRPAPDDVKPPTADSATLDLRKVEPKPDERRRTRLK